MNTVVPHQGSYRAELVRKGIHLFSLLVPIVYYRIGKEQALWILVPLTILFASVDYLRFRSPVLRKWFSDTFGWLLRSHETDEVRKRLNGATYVLIAATLSVLIFPKIIAITSFSVLIICDLSAALIGKRYGKRKFFSKSVEGSLAFFISGVLVILLTPKVANHPVEYLIGVVSVAVGAVVESLSINIDDNLSIPLSVGFVLWGLYYLALPGFLFSIAG